MKLSLRKRRLIIRGIAIVLGVFIGVMFLYPALLQLQGNFHPIVEGEAYRSAQPDAQDLAEYARDYGIRSVLNLRGENTDEDWYQEEVQAAKDLGLTHIDFRMSSKLMMPHERVAELIAIMRSAPKPMLIHCAGGADRSGLAAALYIAAIKHGSEELAEFQLTPFFGHIPLPYLGTPAIDKIFELYEPFLGFHQS